MRTDGAGRVTAMTTATGVAVAAGTRHGEGTTGGAGQRPAPAGVIVLLAALLGFFMLSLDSTAVNVALPGIERDLGGSTAGLQWVIDAYTLMFAALLISAGAISDRVGAKRLYAIGLAAFLMSSAACGLAPTLGFLIGSRAVQGSAAAVHAARPRSRWSGRPSVTRSGARRPSRCGRSAAPWPWRAGR